MQVRLMVERGQDENIVKIAGTAYKFLRNDRGHLVANVTDPSTIAWVSLPRNSSFEPYDGGIAEEVVQDILVDDVFTEAEAPAPIPEGESYAPPNGRFNNIVAQPVFSTVADEHPVVSGDILSQIPVKRVHHRAKGARR